MGAVQTTKTLIAPRLIPLNTKVTHQQLRITIKHLQQRQLFQIYIKPQLPLQQIISSEAQNSNVMSANPGLLIQQILPVSMI